MKKTLFAICCALTLSFITPASANQKVPKKILGTVQELVCGEMDPMVVGDVCLLIIADLAGVKTYGLVLDFYSGAENEARFDKKRRSGEILAILAKDLESLKVDETQVLEEFRSGVIYLRYTGEVEDLLE